MDHFPLHAAKRQKVLSQKKSQLKVYITSSHLTVFISGWIFLIFKSHDDNRAISMTTAQTLAADEDPQMQLKVKASQWIILKN